MQKIKLISSFIILCAFIAHINAYEFSFYNNTDTPIAIAIQYTGIDGTPEPLYGQLAKPNEMIIFTPGKIKIPDIKWGFCLDNIYYVENPTTEQKAYNFKKAPWRKVEITWVKEKSLTKKEKKEPARRKAAPAPGAPIQKVPEKHKASPEEKSLQKSLCKDRHFDIMKDAQGKVFITSSLHD